MNRLFLASVALALTLGAALGGCARDPGTGIATARGAPDPTASEPTGTPAPDLDMEERMLKFAQCMRDNGVDMPDPEFDGNGGVGVRLGGPNESVEDVEQAMQACREYAPNGGEPPGPPDPQMQERALKFAQCMRDNGVESFPDPDGAMMRIDGSVGEDPDFEAAQEKCAAEFLPDAPMTREKREDLQ